MADIVLQIQKRNLISLGPAIKELGLQEGDFLKMEIKDGGLFLRPVSWHDRSQEYFWTEEWQEKMKRSEEALNKGEFQIAHNADELMKHLGGPNADDHSDESV